MNLFTHRALFRTKIMAAMMAVSLLISALPVHFFTAQAANTDAVGIVTAYVTPDPNPDYGEQVQISFSGAGTLDLENWEMSDASSFTYDFPAVSLNNGDSYTVCQTATNNTGCDDTWGGSNVWNNGSDTLTLKDENGDIVLTVVWSSTVPEGDTVTDSGFVDYNDVDDPILGKKDKIALCHATESGSNPYNFMEPNLHSFFGGHDEDTDDIIPPFFYDTSDGIAFFAGNNWTPDNQVLFEDGCGDNEEGNQLTEPIKPIFECYVDNNDGTGTGYFGYLNQNNAPATIPVGEDNKVTGGPTGDDEGQPTEFAPGRTDYVDNAGTFEPGNAAFSVDFDLTGNAVWTLTDPAGDTRTATAGIDGALCPEPEEPPEPSEVPWCSFAGEVIEYTADEDAKQNDGDPVDAERRDTAALATVAPYQNIGGKEGDDWQVDPLDFFSLGIEGYLIYEFTDAVAINQAGDDIAIYEITGGDDGQTEEKARVLVSQNGVDFVEVETITGDGAVDISGTGLDYVKYVKLIDDSAGVQGNDGDGYDVDAIVILDGACGEETRQCTVRLESDTDDYVEEKEGFAKLLSFIHPAWTAVLGSASWIWGDDPVVDPSTAETQTFVKQFGFMGNVTSATLSVASDNDHAVMLNNTAAGSGGSSFAGAVDYDVTSLINETGNNELAIAVTNSAGSSDPASNPAGLLYELVIEGEVTDDADCIVPYEEEVVEECHLPYRVDFGPESDETTFSTTPSDGLVIEEMADGYTIGLYDDGRDGIYRVQGTITFPAGTDTTGFTFTEAGGDDGLEQSHATYPDVADRAGNVITFDLFVNGADDVFTITNDELESEAACDATVPEPEPKASLIITNPAVDDMVLSGEHTFMAEYVDEDDDADAIRWAIREGTCDINAAATVAGNVAGHTDPSTFVGAGFSALVDMSSWDDGEYCFVVNPDEDAGAADLRATRPFILENEIAMCELEVVSDTGTLVDELNDFAVATYESDTWTDDIQNATWVWGTAQVTDPEVDETFTFSETFTATTATSAVLEVAADNGYALYVNGTLVNDRLDQEYNYLDLAVMEYDITSYLVDGENTFHIEVKNFGDSGTNFMQNPAGVLYRLTLEAEAGSCAITTEPRSSEDDDNGGGGGDDEEDTYAVNGYVFHDDDEDRQFRQQEQGGEEGLGGWTVTATAEGQDDHSTTTDENGLYRLELPAGTWTISFQVQNGWGATTPESYVITVPQDLSLNFIQSVRSFFIPTAHAAVIEEYEGEDFGVNETRNSGSSSGVAQFGIGGNPFVAGASTSNDPEDSPKQKVLGEQVSKVPAGAPDAGTGQQLPALNVLSLLYVRRSAHLIK